MEFSAKKVTATQSNISSEKITKYEIRAYKGFCHIEDWTTTDLNHADMKIKKMAVLGEINFVDVYDITTEDKWYDGPIYAYEVSHLFENPDEEFKIEGN